MFRRFLPLALLALPLAVACSVSEATSAPAAPERTNPGDDGTLGVVPENTPLPADKGTADAAGAVGLCGVMTCTPDDNGTMALGANACARSVADGGKPQAKGVDASIDYTDHACRATAAGSAPSCSETTNADSRGVDGVTCQADSDCAAGFDCAAAGPGDKTNVCRRYCCSGSCEGVAAHNGGPTFCDVRQVVRSEASPTPPLIAPVCMPIKTCTLLKKDECAEGETCAIVNDKGTTGCVQTDKQQVKESCEKQHCAAGLTCLGSPGDRTCYKLCTTTTTATTGGQPCADNEVCMTGSTFLDTKYGVCKPAQ